jgi:ATP-dependent Clp protease protease subunit
MNIPTSLVPMVIETTGRGERAFDIYSLLLRNRIIMLGTPISDQIANLIVAQLLFLDNDDPTRPITMYINSPGGMVYSGMAIYDTMQQVSSPVATYAVGFTASFGTVLLTAGTKGMRYALPNATIPSDIAIQAQEILRLRSDLNKILSFHTGQPEDKIAKDTDRDIYMTAKEAVEYGLVDDVLQKPLSENGDSE